MKRYHPALTTLHWLLAGLIILALATGKIFLTQTPNTDPENFGAHQAHMIVGISILALMVIRLGVRLMTKRPPDADIGNKLLNKGASIAHYALYALVFAMAATGLATANAAGLPDIVFFGSGNLLPTYIDDILTRTMHKTLSVVLILVIASHVLAEIYHQFVRKDSLFARMWYGKR